MFIMLHEEKKNNVTSYFGSMKIRPKNKKKPKKQNKQNDSDA